MKSAFHELATAELDEAIAYYDSKSEGLGERLLAEVRAAVEYLEQFPEGSRVIADGVRRKTLVKFPFQLFYVIGEREVLIVAVAHERRRPGYWRSRLM